MQKSMTVFVKSTCETPILAVLGLAFLLGACAQSGRTATTAQKDEAIAIAVVGPMSGDLAPFGEQIRRGAEKAVAEINAKGGVLGRQLRLEIGDDQCDPPRAAQIASDLVSKGVVFVDGHFCSGSSIPASKVYGAAKILQITPASTNPALTEEAATAGLATIMRLAGRDDQQGDTIAEWLIERYSSKPVALLNDGRDYGREVIAVLRERLHGSAVKVVIQQSFPGDQTNFANLAQMIAAAKVEAVFVGGFHHQIAGIARALRDVGSTAELAAADSLNTTEFWTLAGKAGEGVRFTDRPVLAVSPPTRFVASDELEGYGWGSYAAVEAFVAAAEATGGTGGVELAAWLRAHRVETILGGLEWDAKGDLRGISYRWSFWRDGKVQD